MPKIFHKRNGSWTEVKSVFHKRNSAWTEVLNVFRKTSGSWVKVFAAAKIPGNTVAPTITGSGYLFGTLTNTNLGTWTNTPTSYARQWRRGNPSAGGGEPTSYSNISGETSSTYVTTSADNGKYIVCQVTATNAVGSNVAVSNLIYVKKYDPVSLLPYTISGSPTVGSTLTALEQIGSWKNTTTNTGDTYPDTFEYEWSYTDGTIIQSSTLSISSFPRNVNSSTLLLTTSDLNKQIRVRVTGTNTGASATSGYSTSTSIVTQPYRFSFGNILYVSSNGHIGLDSGASSYTSMSSGRNIAVFIKDLEQYYLAEYSDSSSYYLYIRSYLYGSSASSVNALDYQIRFYNNSSINYCDVYIVRKGSNVATASDIAPGYYASGTTGYAGMTGPYVIGAGTVFRVYFGDTAATTSGISWTSVSDSLWDVIQTWTYPGGGGDDTFTAVTTAANQQAPTPVNTSLPTLTTDTGNFSAGSTITINAGTWTGTSSYAYALNWSTSTPISDTETNTKTLINTNQYVITNADASAPSYYFRGRVTGYSGSGQTGNSAIARSATSARSNINRTTTISVATATSSGFTISGTAGPLNGFGSTYANITSIQIYNSSFGLVSTITTGLPTVNGTTGEWSYVWTAGSASTTYYAKATVTAIDSDQTTFTTGFSSSITTTAATVLPGAPTGLSVSRSVGSNFMSTSLSPSASGNSTKTQTWSFGRNTTFTINFTRGSNATSSEMYYSTTNSTPSASTSQNGGTSTSASGTFSYVGAASTTSDNDYAVYFWVRSTTATDNSAWTYAGTQNVDTPLYSGFEIRLYRTNTSSGVFTTQTPSRNALTYDWTSVATGFAHQAQVRLTFDGTALIRSS
jgi:hypothetical protein